MKKKCPFRGGKCDDCELYVELIYENAVTNEKKPERKCAISWIPLLMIEGTKVGIQQTRATESLRNEQVKGQKIVGIAAQALIAIAEQNAGKQLPANEDKTNAIESKASQTEGSTDRG